MVMKEETGTCPCCGKEFKTNLTDSRGVAWTACASCKAGDCPVHDKKKKEKKK